MQREKTLRAYKREQLKKDPHFKFLPENRRRGAPAEGGASAGDSAAAYLDPACVAGVTPGQRCQLHPGGRRGVVRWVGAEVAGLQAGHWVGVQLDEPVGVGNGSRGGVTYFECGDKYGSFARPDRVEVGDFPPELDDLGVADGTDGGAATEPAATAAVTVPVAEPQASQGLPAASGPKAKVKRRGADEDDESDSEL